MNGATPIAHFFCTLSATPNSREAEIGGNDVV